LGGKPKFSINNPKREYKGKKWREAFLCSMGAKIEFNVQGIGTL